MTDAAVLFTTTPCEGTLTVGGLALVGQPAWNAYDLSALLGSPEKYGDDLPIAGAATLGRPRRSTTTRLLFPMVFAGSKTPAGAAAADADHQLVVNVETFKNATTRAAGAATTGTLAAVWTLPDGVTTRSAQVHALRLTGRRTPGALFVAVFEIAVPTGEFV